MQKNMNLDLIAKNVWKNPLYFIAFGFGSGLMPIAPGTFGTLAAIPIYLMMVGLSWPCYLCLTLIAFIMGVFVCDKVTSELGVQDYSGIVWDEVVGFIITMFMAPVGIIWVAVGFGLFRLFDIWKPQPIRWVDKHVQGGIGIMVDDVLAGILALAIMQIFRVLFVK
jgi:phosphatidylglycerophosphatase A